MGNSVQVLATSAFANMVPTVFPPNMMLAMSVNVPSFTMEIIASIQCKSATLIGGDIGFVGPVSVMKKEDSIRTVIRPQESAIARFVNCLFLLMCLLFIYYLLFCLLVVECLLLNCLILFILIAEWWVTI